VNVPHVLTAESLRLPGVGHGFFTRIGGVSRGVYASLNGGAGSRDSHEAVAENRSRAAVALGVAPERLAVPYQIHSADAAPISEPWAPGGRPRCDGLATATPGLALGVTGASIIFALALLASGQNSTLTGTLAGQIVMEGFINIRLRPWLRRLITRAIAIIPAVCVIGFFGESKTTQLLVASQVVLSMQLGFAIWPLMRFTGEKKKMGEFANPRWIKILGWTTAAIIIVLNAKLLYDMVK